MLSAGCSAEVRDYVRLHVVASDDGDAAQALKLEVRDAVLAEARRLLEGARDTDAAWETVVSHRDELETAARRRAREAGFDGEVACETGVFAFPDRVYGGVTVPAGDYRALRVMLGEGRGHNWWCVLYPSLCYPEGMEAPAFHSVILDWLRSLFGGTEP